MIITKDIIFIHIGKTGGMSCSTFLEQNLCAPIYSCHIPHKGKPARSHPNGVVAVTDIGRHASLSEVEHKIPIYTKTAIAEMKKILAVVRNPYTLEYSYYKHLQRPVIIERQKQSNPQFYEQTKGGFKNFVKKSGYLKPGHRQEDYFLINGEVPPNLQLIRFEELAQEFPAAVKPFMRKRGRLALSAAATGLLPTPKALVFPWKNTSAASTDDLRALLDEETRELIYQKHRYMFDQGYYSVDSLRD